MVFNLNIPLSNSEKLNITVDSGECLFLLGANGAGKSSLMHHFYAANHGNARRISAHRQTWFSSNSLALSPEQKRNTEANIQGRDTDPQARWKDDFSAQRASIAIFDLIDAENVRARSIADEVDKDNLDLARKLSQKESPIKIINELLNLSNIPVKISVLESEKVVASKLGGDNYSIAELSDGERNAILILAAVLTVKEGSLILIDEPERHLHRSIISPLLVLMFSKRTDCAFVVSSHEVMLPLDIPRSRTILVRGCTYSASRVVAWDVDFVDAESDIQDDLKKDILGARRKLVFIEGMERSLDKPLYSLIFPNISIITKESCRSVERAVQGIRASENLHWLRAFGIIDNDGRTQEDVQKLKSKGIYALSVFSVESIYYHPDVQRRIAERHSAVTGQNASDRLAAANTAALAAIVPHTRRLSERAVEKQIREAVLRQIPNMNQIADAAPITLKFDIAEYISVEHNRILQALASGNLPIIIARYPIRETAALSEIVQKLGFQNREQYESAVRKLLVDDIEALLFVKSLFKDLINDIGSD